MFDIVLHQPEIAPNTGNIIRLSANTGCRLHLIGPMGFNLDHAKLKRAGLDYHEYASLELHASFSDYLLRRLQPGRVFGFSTRAQRHYHEAQFMPGDALVFGSETRGLPALLRDSFDPAHLLRLPMRAQSRSLNLANSVAVVVYEAWRQNGFDGASSSQ
jgi:tRNA (cytidine/uridine-2'-O-)-methyltransferase